MGRFYIYVFWYRDGNLAYIGKGSGDRFRNQKRRLRRISFVDGRIVWRHDDEDKAYRFERRLIYRHQPPLNRRSGGTGGRYGVGSRKWKLKKAIRDAEFSLRTLKPVHRIADENKGIPGAVEMYRNTRLWLVRLRNRARRELEAING